ncbi:MAG: 4-hydroxy-3-methylbut-2-enyl diphosphate reductase [Pseudonocardiales bacterium]|nr:4-hydroxy-3-methylbut-2-enyl diphosphate reductase [Pseudonocardiales bacterium]MBV9729423.1 4-hydroxy-3-methylbut-2-enyl diphosphate reductase [Pseudonocardiales bacterium]
MRLVHTGMGPRRASATAAALATSTDPVLVAGVGGGLAPQVRPGDVVVASEVREASRAENALRPPSSASELLSRTRAALLSNSAIGGLLADSASGSVEVPSAPLLAGALRRLGLTVHIGPISSISRLARTPIVDGALAVDMESAQLATADVPFAVVRAIVDTTDHPLWRLGMPRRGVRALRTLRACQPALEWWAAATGPREVLLAAPRSFCAGVARAIDTVHHALRRYGAPVYVRRQIVHNAHVVDELAARGAVFVDEVDQVPAGGVLVFAAHGVAPAVRQDAAARELTVIDATCPLVTKVHSEIRRYARRQNTVFLIGHSDHEEVQGSLGEAPEDVIVVPDVDTAQRVAPRDPSRVAYTMQTTLAVDEAEEIAGVLRDRFPALSAPRTDDICYATTNRQRAVRAIAGQVDLVLVVGSPNSSNSVRLVEVAQREGVPAYLVEDVSEIDLGALAGTTRLGITAGASAPPHLVDQIVYCLGGLGPVTMTELRLMEEDVTFALPREMS